MNKIIISISFCVAVFIFSTVEVFGCTCIAPEPVADEYKRNTAIFSGQVISSIKSGKSARKVKIRVKDRWKGKSSKIITISTSAVGAMCGYNFVKGKSYLIYADSDESNALWVSICSRTKLLSESKEDIEALNNLRAKNDSKN
jgi:hypothetical protein